MYAHEQNFKKGRFPEDKLSQLELFLRMSEKRGPAKLILTIDELKDEPPATSKYRLLCEQYKGERNIPFVDAMQFLINNEIISQQYGHGGDNYDYQINLRVKNFIIGSARFISEYQEKGKVDPIEVLGESNPLKKFSKTRMKRFALLETLANKGKQRQSHLLYKRIGLRDISLFKRNRLLTLDEEEVNEILYTFYYLNREKKERLDEIQSPPETKKILEMFFKRKSWNHTSLFRVSPLSLGKTLDAVNYLQENSFIHGGKPFYNKKKVLLSLTERGTKAWESFFKPLKEIVMKKVY